jgi:hypothetical protein
VREPAFENPRAEAARLRHLYRTLAVRGRLNLPPDAALPLVGPDCAYHLYRLAPLAAGDPSGASPPTGPVLPHPEGSDA